jgi:hypothetical protein
MKMERGFAGVREQGKCAYKGHPVTWEISQ